MQTIMIPVNIFIQTISITTITITSQTECHLLTGGYRFAKDQKRESYWISHEKDVDEREHVEDEADGGRRKIIMKIIEKDIFAVIARTCNYKDKK